MEPPFSQQVNGQGRVRPARPHLARHGWRQTRFPGQPAVLRPPMIALDYLPENGKSLKSRLLTQARFRTKPKINQRSDQL